MAETKQYDHEVTINLNVASGAIIKGYLYAINTDGTPIPADRTTPKEAVGFAPFALSAKDGNTGQKAVALSTKGIIECAAGDIAGGAFTVGAKVYLDVGGKYTTTKPTTAGQYLQQVGIAMTTTKVFVAITPALTIQAAGTTTSAA